ncbi:MAG: hypothetical protein U0271_01260 [Polyangiaceae bacterium]
MNNPLERGATNLSAEATAELARPSEPGSAVARLAEHLAEGEDGARKKAHIHRSGAGRTLVFEARDFEAGDAPLASSSEQLTVYSPTGAVELAVRFTPDGPVLSFSAARIAVESENDISFDCENFEVRARKSVSVRSAGDLVHDVVGDLTSRVGGKSETRASRLALAATAGDIDIDGAGDAWITAKNVLLNCDRELEMAERAWKEAAEQAERVRTKLASVRAARESAGESAEATTPPREEPPQKS